MCSFPALVQFPLMRLQLLPDNFRPRAICDGIFCTLVQLVVDPPPIGVFFVIVPWRRCCVLLRRSLRGWRCPLSILCHRRCGDQGKPLSLPIGLSSFLVSCVSYAAFFAAPGYPTQRTAIPFEIISMRSSSPAARRHERAQSRCRSPIAIRGCWRACALA